MLARGTHRGGRGFHHQPILSHRVVAQNLALEDPDLDAAHAIGGVGGRLGIIDIAAQRVERNAAFAIPFRARDLGAAEAAAPGAPDTLGGQPKRRLTTAVHRNGRASWRERECQYVVVSVGDGSYNNKTQNKS